MEVPGPSTANCCAVIADRIVTAAPADSNAAETSGTWASELDDHQTTTIVSVAELSPPTRNGGNLFFDAYRYDREHFPK
jgi:hypothetical protein